MNGTVVRACQGTASLAILASGRGRTLANLQGAIARGELDARITHVASTRPCPALDLAQADGIRVAQLDPSEVSGFLDASACDFAVLAGYTRLVDVPPRLDGRVVNIHPALLPSFGGQGMYGRRVHEAVLAAGCTVSGCTVHLANTEYDRGPIVRQATCPVLPDDDADALAARVFDLECSVYPQAIGDLLSGYRVVGNRVIAGDVS